MNSITMKVFLRATPLTLLVNRAPTLAPISVPRTTGAAMNASQY